MFGKSRIDEISADMEIPLAGRIPIETAYAEKADAGTFAEVENTHLEKALDLIRQQAG